MMHTHTHTHTHTTAHTHVCVADGEDIIHTHTHTHTHTHVADGEDLGAIRAHVRRVHGRDSSPGSRGPCRLLFHGHQARQWWRARARSPVHICIVCVCVSVSVSVSVSVPVPVFAIAGALPRVSCVATHSHMSRSLPLFRVRVCERVGSLSL